MRSRGVHAISASDRDLSTRPQNVAEPVLSFTLKADRPGQLQGPVPRHHGRHTRAGPPSSSRGPPKLFSSGGLGIISCSAIPPSGLNNHHRDVGDPLRGNTRLRRSRPPGGDGKPLISRRQRHLVASWCKTFDQGHTPQRRRWQRISTGTTSAFSWTMTGRPDLVRKYVRGLPMFPPLTRRGRSGSRLSEC